MTSLRFVALALLPIISSVACDVETTERTDVETISKEEARDLAKADLVTDFCAIFDWYGDDICDTFCLDPDPDCESVPTCEVDGEVYALGESFPNPGGCGSCTCNEIGPICTMADCAPVPTCEVDGEVYEVGESFPNPGGCGACTCNEIGPVCTMADCAPVD